MNSLTIPSSLREEDIPGVSLGEQEPKDLKVKELQRWLVCRGASTRGKKADLIARVQAYIRNGWANNLVDPDKPQAADSTASTYLSRVPVDGWINIRTAFKSKAEILVFSHTQIVSYFMTRTVSDGLPAADFKSINKSAENLFKCGHVQNIEFCSKNEDLWVRATCLPEMRKDRVYKVVMALESKKLDIQSAECGCPAGRGPTASCKHVSALCYALVSFCTVGRLPEFLTSTQKLQEWNRPHSKRVETIPVEDFGARKHKILGHTSTNRIRPIPKEYDPCPMHLRSSNSLRVETLRTDLLSLNPQAVMLHLLCPPIEKVDHDHSYAKSSLTDDTHGPSGDVSLTQSCPFSDVEFLHLCEVAKKALNVSQEERLIIESNTREQSSTLMWHSVRARRINGSKCSKILTQKTKTPALLKQVLYAAPFTFVPKPIQWGRDNEVVVCRKYIEHMSSKQIHVQVEKCGFIVHPQLGWLGASPDAKVTDPTITPPNGIAEFKCPYTKRKLSLNVACSDPEFYGDLTADGRLVLRRNHAYYHQVQLQLFVCQDLYKWCDFCIYTKIGILVERIALDQVWCETNIPQLEKYFNEYMLPEIVYPQLKPAYFL